MMLYRRYTIQESNLQLVIVVCVAKSNHTSLGPPPTATLPGYNNPENGRILKKLFDRPYFKVKLLPDAVSADRGGQCQITWIQGVGGWGGAGGVLGEWDRQILWMQYVRQLHRTKGSSGLWMITY